MAIEVKPNLSLKYKGFMPYQGIQDAWGLGANIPADFGASQQIPKVDMAGKWASILPDLKNMFTPETWQKDPLGTAAATGFLYNLSPDARRDAIQAQLDYAGKLAETMQAYRERNENRQLLIDAVRNIPKAFTRYPNAEAVANRLAAAGPAYAQGLQAAGGFSQAPISNYQYYQV